jgi:deoxyribose-phosphate aldolase
VNLLDESYPDLPPPAAVCIYPDLVAVARSTLSNPLVNLASVGGGFPSSQTFMAVKLLEIELAIQDGADEIDIVMPVGKFLNGKYQEVFDEIKEIKEQLGTLHLKVILESGVLPDLTQVQKASILALEAGADFIKTSTGKAGTGATPEAFTVMCMAIRDFYGKTGKKAGIKPAGGISAAETAYEYYSIVHHVLGESWLNPEKFRIGASRLANNLIRIIFNKEENFNYF